MKFIISPFPLKCQILGFCTGDIYIFLCMKLNRCLVGIYSVHRTLWNTKRWREFRSVDKELCFVVPGMLKLTQYMTLAMISQLLWVSVSHSINWGSWITIAHFNSNMLGKLQWSTLPRTVYFKLGTLFLIF